MASSSSSPPVKNYDVFLSFRGADTRNNIVSHLHEALTVRDVSTFIDNERIEVGDKITERLIEAIKTSRFAVVVISENYATSKWCLEELRLIMELQRENKIQVVPMFYKVVPSTVRYQTGTFEAAFQKHENPDRQRTTDTKPNRVADWRGALTQLADLSGLDFTTNIPEAAMVRTIVEKITKELDVMKLKGYIKLVGMEAQMKTMERLLNMEPEDVVRKIGIWGMGGIGKTTIAKCLYAKFASKFPAHCFIENILDVYLHQGPHYIKKKIRFRILSGEAGFEDIKARLGNEKVLVVLDGVDEPEQVRTLADEINWLRPGSRIIITTRDKGLLYSCGVDILHEVKCLDDKDSLKVFTELAFGGKPAPFGGSEQLFIRASRLAHGLPSALDSYASYLSEKKTAEEWEGSLRLLEKHPRKSVLKILKNSYDNLWEPSQTAFLHVACLFNGYPLSHVSDLLIDGRPRIDDLVGKSLISISDDDCINMHALVVQTGREIVRLESKDGPPGQKFIWDAKQLYDVLGEGTGTKKIEGVGLHMCNMPGILHMSDRVFRRMRNLEFLKFFQHFGDGKATLQLNSDPLYFPPNLRLLHWDAYPLEKWPSSLRPNHLVELNLRYSNLVRLWDWTMDLEKLRRLDVTGSRNLKGLPDLSTAKNLKELIMKGCSRLEGIPESILTRSDRLKKINAVHCDILRGTKFTVELQIRSYRLIFPNKKVTIDCLTDLSIDGQIDIDFTYLCGNADHLELLHFSENEIPDKSVKAKFEDYYGLKSLVIKRFNYTKPPDRFLCLSLRQFPTLAELNLVNLSIPNIPDNIDHMQLVTKMDLSGNDFVCLPRTMRKLAKLKYLSLRNCSSLVSLPQLTQVETLILSDCENLRTVVHIGATQEHGTYCLLELWIDNCRKVQNLSVELCHLTKISYLDLSRNDFVAAPASIRELSSLGTLLLKNCKKLNSVTELPENLEFLYVQGCDFLESITLSPNDSIKHLCHTHCPRLQLDEHLLARFSEDEHGQEEVPPRSCTLYETASHFDNEAPERIRQLSVWTTLTGNCFQFLEAFF